MANSNPKKKLVVTISSEDALRYIEYIKIARGCSDIEALEVSVAVLRYFEEAILNGNEILLFKKAEKNPKAKTNWLQRLFSNSDSETTVPNIREVILHSMNDKSKLGKLPKL